ncbi:MAG TPA: response regulator [Chloroflexota bacterium]|nr:response regulator [Chloroflexota bacterium]
MLRLLIADDEDLVRRGLATLIDREAGDLEIIGVAADGLEALALAREGRPDIMLTDIRMPGLGGLQLIQQLRPEFPNLRYVILSGYDEFEYARQAISLGVAEYLLKPVDPDDLLSTLRRMVGEIEAERRQERLIQSTPRLAAELGLRRLLEGLPVEPAALAGCLPESAAWELFLVREEQPRPAELAALSELCRAALADVTVVEDAYGYLCVLAPAAGLVTEPLILLAHGLNEALVGAGRQATVLAARPCADLSSIHQCYEEAVRVAEYTRPRPDGQPVLTWDLLPSNTERWPLLPAASRDALLDAVANGDPDGAAHHACAALRSALEQNALGPLRAVWLELAILIIHRVQEEGAPTETLLDPRNVLADTRAAPRLEERLVALARDAASACRQARERQTPRNAMADLRDYIAGHLNEDLTITALARRMHRNGKYLGELFKQVTGEPLGAYVIRMRMRRACELLTSTDLRVHAVAEQIGYADPKHFSSMFRSLIGVSPAEYREQRAREVGQSREHAASCTA